MREKIVTFIKGFVTGGTMLVPGVSGGSMAMILGIYEKLIHSVSKFMKQKRKSSIFLGIFSLGAVIGMFLFAKAVKHLLEVYPMPVMYFFVGAVIGGIPLILKSCDVKKVETKTIIYPIIGAIIVIAITFIPENIANVSSIHSVKGIVVLLIAGFLSAIAFVLPGISFSFVLLVLGLYHNVIKAFNDFDIYYLAVLAIGLIIGVICTTRVVELALTKYTQATYLVILGFVVGSVIPVFPGLPAGIEWIICPIMLALGVLFIQLLQRLDTAEA